MQTLSIDQLTHVTGGKGVDPIAVGEGIHEGYQDFKKGMEELDPVFQGAKKTVKRWTKHAPGFLHRWFKHI